MSRAKASLRLVAAGHVDQGTEDDRERAGSIIGDLLADAYEAESRQRFGLIKRLREAVLVRCSMSTSGRSARSQWPQVLTGGGE